jgi:tRNA acetyltransferase TAN1
VNEVKPTEKFDLLVTFEEDLTYYEQLIDEIEMILKNMMNSFYIKESEINNVLMVELGSDDLKKSLKLAEETITTVPKFIHIEFVVRTRLDKIVEKVINISRDKIKKGETFKIECDLRGTRYIASKEILLESLHKEITEELKILPDENNPDWLIHIEVVGENTGISVLKKST